MDDLWQFLHVLRMKLLAWCGGTRDPKGIGFPGKSRVAADEFGVYLARDRHDRNRIHHGVDKAGHEIRRAWT